jgi:hypothetical protein
MTLIIKKFGIESVYDFDDKNGDPCSISQYDDGDVEFCFEDGCLLSREQVIAFANHLLEIAND